MTQLGAEPQDREGALATSSCRSSGVLLDLKSFFCGEFVVGDFQGAVSGNAESPDLSVLVLEVDMANKNFGFHGGEVLGEGICSEGETMEGSLNCGRSRALEGDALE